MVCCTLAAAASWKEESEDNRDDEPSGRALAHELEPICTASPGQQRAHQPREGVARARGDGAAARLPEVPTCKREAGTSELRFAPRED